MLLHVPFSLASGVSPSANEKESSSILVIVTVALKFVEPAIVILSPVKRPWFGEVAIVLSSLSVKAVIVPLLPLP